MVRGILYAGLGILFLLFLGGFSSGIVTPEKPSSLDMITGTLHIDGDPPGMEITLDGKSFGIVPYSGVLILDSVQVGNHRLQVAMDGYIPKEMVVTVPDGLPVEVRVNLVKVKLGELYVTSSPDNVQAYLDDVYKGITPVHLPGITPGIHTVMLKLPGYEDWSVQTEVQSDQETPVTGTLSPLQTAPGSVNTPSGGQDLLLQIMLSIVGCLCAIILIKTKTK